jgi:hypothetical protein
MRWTVLVVMMTGLAATALSAAPADAKRKPVRRYAPAIEVRPSPAPPVLRQNPASVQLPPVDWTDDLRWRPLTPAELRASSHVVRRCTGGYALEHRPSGTVLTPQERCWWAVRPQARFP